MLVLSRKPGERIVIGEDISIVVNRISGNRVSIGVEAPNDVKIVRGELEQFTDEFADENETGSQEPIIAPQTSFDDSTIGFLSRVAR